MIECKTGRLWMFKSAIHVDGHGEVTIKMLRQPQSIFLFGLSRKADKVCGHHNSQNSQSSLWENVQLEMNIFGHAHQSMLRSAGFA